MGSKTASLKESVIILFKLSRSLFINFVTATPTLLLCLACQRPLSRQVCASEKYYIIGESFTAAALLYYWSVFVYEVADTTRVARIVPKRSRKPVGSEWIDVVQLISQEVLNTLNLRSLLSPHKISPKYPICCVHSFPFHKTSLGHRIPEGIAS